MSAHAVVFHSTPRAGNSVRKFLRTLAITALGLMGATAAFAANGLIGDYYNTRDLSGPIVLRRTDATINSDWGNGSPDTSIRVDNFSARWTGFVTTTTAGQYKFTTRSDDGIRLWVNNQLVVDSWIDQGPTDHSGNITLDAGTTYALKVEFYENGGGAYAQLRWTPPGGSDVVIPAGNLTNPGFVATPAIEPDNALITTGSIEVSMSTTTPGAEIHYTNDQNTPTESSPLYTGPFTVAVSGPTYITAKAFKNGLEASIPRTVRLVPGSLNFPSGVTDANAGLLQFNGNASRSGSTIRLTDGGLWDRRSSVYSIGTVEINSFVTSFTFTQTKSSEYTGEGMTFTIQNSAPDALGNGGQELGYGGIAKSLAIKFDVRKNGTVDPSDSSTGLFQNGAAPLGGTTLLPTIELATPAVMQADISYLGSTLSVTLKNTGSGNAVTNTYNVDIPAIVGGNRAFLGFTAASGGVTTLEQRVLTWTYSAATPATITGAITLQGSTHADVPLIFEFRPQDNSGNFTRTLTPAANGDYSVTVPRKNYVVAIKGAKWLRKLITVNVSNGDSSNNNATLLGGDANNDNLVDILDLSALIASFDADPSSPNWNQGRADFNLDDLVDQLDLARIIENFDLEGDP